MRKAFAGMLLFGVLLSGARAAGQECPEREGTPETAEELGPIEVGEEAPSFGGWALGERRVVGLDDLLEAEEPPTRAVVVSFFATWCEPCREGLRTIDRVVEARSDDGVRALLVAVGQRGEEVRSWLDDLGVSLRGVADPYRSVAERYGVSKGAGGDEPEEGEASLPKSFVLDGEGRVRAIYADESGGFCAHLQRTLDEVAAPDDEGGADDVGSGDASE